MFDNVKKFIAGEEGATVIEYCVLIALIAAVVIVIIGVLGERVDNSFERLNSQLTN